MIKRDDPFVCEKDGPLVPLNLFDFGERFEVVWEGSTRQGDGECTSLVDRVCLSFEDEVGEGGGQVGDLGEFI